MARILDVRRLRVGFRTKFGQVNAVNDISFHIDEGEVLAVVGESGSGKSVSALSLLGLIAKNGKILGGEIDWGGVNLAKLSEAELKNIRGSEISMIFQDPMSCLNPVLTIGYQMEEALRFHKKDMSKSDRRDRMLEMLEKVKMQNPGERLKQYPHELSGGMRQRIMIAISLLCQPKLLIADEPTTALDVTIQAQIMNLIRDLGEEFNTSVMLITHNLGVVAGMADRVSVMYAGEIVESAPVDEVFYRSGHPYTQGLIKALPQAGKSGEALVPIPGSTPDLLLEQSGCMFFERCERAMECCRDYAPPVYAVSGSQSVKCWIHHPNFAESSAEDGAESEGVDT